MVVAAAQSKAGLRVGGGRLVELRDFTVAAAESRVEKRNALRVPPLRDRLQIGVDVRQILVGEDLLAEWRHVAVGGTHEGLQRLERDRIGCELEARHTALPLVAVALPAAVLEKFLLALRGVGRKRALAENEAGGKRRQPDY